MQATLELPEALLRKAMALTKIATETELVKFALENIIRQEETRKLVDYFGKVDLDIDLDKLRSR
ncbi:MAG: type II toxin-antitoxin system VapB family antitoxin [Treponema sp.]|nr:type II toxin-antitoxin system VapB family antitoxin [Treponema sp.]MCL2190763.1 type II toxin-antitoxin system VapB family antitoxin [Treponema sp.]